MSATDPWVNRFIERQKFIDQLKSNIVQHRNESRSSALNEHLSMCRVYIEFIENTERERLGVVEVDGEHRTFFRKHILCPIREFASTEDEVVSLVAELLMWTGELIARKVGGAYFDRRMHS